MNLSKIKAEILRHVKFEEEDFFQFSNYCKTVKLQKNEIWESANKVSKNMGFINTGILRQYFIKDGAEYTNNFYFENDFVGNYISYLSNEPSKTYTIAIEACELIILPFAELQRICKILPAAEEFSRKIGDQKLFALNERNASFLMDSPEERYSDLLRRRPDLVNRVPQYLIAQYLGIKPESLSRIRNRNRARKIS